MATKRRKRDDRMEQVKGPEIVFEDRISDLPDAIIIHVLSFLPTLYAIRTSLLSKRWRSMWTLVPVLDFCDSRDIRDSKRHNERNDRREKFYKFVDECLEHPYAETTISKLKLNMEDYGDSSRMNGWLRFPLKKNIHELNLRVRGAGYCIPQFILHLRALTVLKLNGLAVRYLFPSSLPSLKELYLMKIQMANQALDYLLMGCPCLEILHVNYSYGLLNPKVKSLSLKSLDFRTGGGKDRHAHTIDVEAINLHSFLYSQGGRKKCNINLVQCRAIRNLTLIGAFLTDQWLEDLIPQLPLLESLRLTNCYGLQHMKIWNQHLKDFVLSVDRRLGSLEASIDTPNLVSFSYCGYKMFKISINAPNLLDAYINFPAYPRMNYNIEWYTSLIKFLSVFNGSKKVCVFSFHEKALIIPDEVKKICSSPLPDLKHMKVQTATGSRLHGKVMLRKSLLWIAPSNLETLPIG
ncbi:F-box/FBD/LRR-repeat protein At2g04230 [Morus notabilis]|uniref:F-box/FBD/LRR-repeat protein At2g04230 n=1 Tax=Morus notabilis TaxID=981085 RepID=UPI000CED3146|nr:F-box/FBD/LRR-repeat protein At2g04230 [Morus notabilis]